VSYILKCDTLRVREYSKHDRCTSPINDQQSVLESRADLCAFYEALCWSVNIVSHFLHLVILDLVRGQITDISISCSPSLSTSLLLVHDIASSVIESHACKLHRCNCHRVGPKYQSVARMDKSCSWCTRLNIPHRHTKRHIFSQCSYGNDGWCNQSSLRM
jgi:hypothetical protein